jgi:pyrroline-5-carboxylate reductase
MRKIGFIGCGHMAKALIKGLQKNSSYIVSGHDRNEVNLAWLEHESIAQQSLENICTESDIVVICVRPKDMYDLCVSMNNIIGDDIKIVSVAAGVTLENLKTALPGRRIYRAIPNIGAKDNLGITSIFSSEQDDEILEIFNFLGKAFRVDNEEKINLHTSLIGSGPAFYFEIINEFENRLDELLPNNVSKRDITLLFLTSLISAIKNGENLEDLIASIKSKGGTTEAGLNLLYNENFIKIFSDAIDAAKNRATELSMD